MMQSVETTLSREEIQQVLSVLQELDPRLTSGRDQRRDSRHAVEMDVWIRRFNSHGHSTNGQGSGGSQLFKVMMHDASKRGIGFTSRRSFAKGETFVVPLRFSDGGGQLVLCCTRHCSELPDGQYRIGAEFLSVLPDPDGKTRIPLEWMYG